VREALEEAVVASYTHDTSRQLDPPLNTHAVAANLTYDGTEGRWKALQASGLYERRSYLTEVYRNALMKAIKQWRFAPAGSKESLAVKLEFDPHR
jgi:conjugative relaxase-like TrwC/TraI family protein